MYTVIYFMAWFILGAVLSSADVRWTTWKYWTIIALVIAIVLTSANLSQ